MPINQPSHPSDRALAPQPLREDGFEPVDDGETGLGVLDGDTDELGRLEHIAKLRDQRYRGTISRGSEEEIETSDRDDAA